MTAPEHTGALLWREGIAHDALALSLLFAQGYERHHGQMTDEEFLEVVVAPLIEVQTHSSPQGFRYGLEAAVAEECWDVDFVGQMASAYDRTRGW